MDNSGAAKSADDDGVFTLLTALCNNVAFKYCHQSNISQKRLANKMRTHSYEIILKKSDQEISSSDRDPVLDLMCYYYTSKKNLKNVAQYKRCKDLKEVIAKIRQTDFNHLRSVLKFLVKLNNTVKEDIASAMYHKPFSFGLLNEMLPKPQTEVFGSTDPYPYFPADVFNLPYSINIPQELDLDRKSYTMESFDSRLSHITPQVQGSVCLKSFISPISIACLTSTRTSSYSDNLMNFPRLTGPRDLVIPSSCDLKYKVSLASTTADSVITEDRRSKLFEECINIWELASQVDKNVPDDIWEIVSKLPAITERQLIASSPRELRLFQQTYGGTLARLHVSTEKQFIRHLMYLIIGVETSTFPFNEETRCFQMKEDLVIEGVSRERLRDYVGDLALVGTYYRRLYRFAFNHTLDDNFHSNGLIYEAAREVVRRYLLKFRLKATEIYEGFSKNCTEETNLPTLLQIRYHIEPLKYEIETVASIFNMIETEPKAIPCGAELICYLFDEISLITHKESSLIMFTSLVAICKVYFKFIERFIFEGELEDSHGEFFVRTEPQHARSRCKRYWDRGYGALPAAAPRLLRPLARLDPLVLLISSDHPSIKCCTSFEELARQQQILEVYRTRCLFVSGQRVTFDQILLKREAERKAFAEMASVKQAETLEKIVAERKRLAQLIQAEKQHSLRVLEAAMAEAKAVKLSAKQREMRRSRLERDAATATEDVDSRIKDDERNKIMQYYSKLNLQVEKSKIHTEWKIKRLQLDQSRMQLLYTEERNLKREKLELEHQRNEEMAMSIQSVDSNIEAKGDGIVESTSSVIQVSDSPEDIHVETKSGDVFRVICNAAKSIFGVGKTNDRECDNGQKLDTQGNVISEIEPNSNEIVKSSDAIGRHLDDAYDNMQYLKMREQAVLNKQKVMAHEFGQVDNENNEMLPAPTINLEVDEENNSEDYSPFAQARRNRLKVLGDEFGLKPKAIVAKEAITVAQKEALINKQKVLGVEYNLPVEITRREPANIAQEEALKNKRKVLGSDYDSKPDEVFDKRETAKRSGLTLNLKPFSETLGAHSVTTPNTLTPGDYFSALDLETPTTADVPLEGAITGEPFTPRSEHGKDTETDKETDKKFITSDGFNFSVIVDDAVESEVANEVPTTDSPFNSPLNVDSEMKGFRNQYSIFNLLDGSYNLDEFDPFGVRDLKSFSRNHFNSRMDLDMSTSVYTHPRVIMAEVKKPPYSNIFATHFDRENEKDEVVTCDNLATLTACLQRSVMLPLTYQLEVVNNSILTFFLVDLDMYEHMRSLRDYFFLMDGEFSRSLCHNLFAKLTKTLNPQELLNFTTLRNILDAALGSSISHVHKFSESVSFSLAQPAAGAGAGWQAGSPDALACLALTYAVRWPLNIIISQEALTRYARVFQFRVKMRRVCWMLADSFEDLKLTAKLSKYSRRLLKSSQYISVQLYRHIMASMVRALDNYIVTTCILTSWTEFESDLKKARTLDDLYECHVVYIKKVLFRCLLNNRSTPVMKLFNDIFTVILKFNRVLKAG
ncbi:hypothetical protein ACJJTC_009514, partial [Scirpophaga incertulas]